MKKTNVTYEEEFNGYPVNTSKEKQLGCLVPTLERYRQHLEDMTSRHNKVMQTRFDLRYPSDGSVKFDKAHIYRFSDGLKKHFSRMNKSNHKVDLKLDWSPDQKESSAYPHYHCNALVNGNAIQSEYTILKAAEHYWGKALKSENQGLVNYCNKGRDGEKQENGLMYRRGDERCLEVKDKMFHQASYLAKIRDKEGLRKGSHSRGGSQLKK